jgi:hypothetical protein
MPRNTAEEVEPLWKIESKEVANQGLRSLWELLNRVTSDLPRQSVHSMRRHGSRGEKPQALPAPDGDPLP